jgi:glycosyltransferase involved in cell wall biosynthesis
VGDDCSTDATQSLLRRYAAKYPEKVEVFFSPVNLGVLHKDRVSIKLLNRCTSKYIAILEGDDYWIDPHKLQRQVEYLDSHSECSVCFHNAEMFYDDGSQPSTNLRPADQKEISTIEDVLSGMVPLPCTVMFRNNLLGELPDAFYEVTNADWMMYVLLAEHGHIGYINKVMAAYRMHAAGMWSRLTAQQRVNEHIKTYKTIDEHLNFKYEGLISEKIAQFKEVHARSCLGQYHEVIRKGELRTGLRLLMEATQFAPLEVLQPRLLAAVLKNGLLGILWKTNEEN